MSNWHQEKENHISDIKQNTRALFGVNIAFSHFRRLVSVIDNCVLLSLCFLMLNCIARTDLHARAVVEPKLQQPRRGLILRESSLVFCSQQFLRTAFGTETGN